jgi:hypothetical protein
MLTDDVTLSMAWLAASGDHVVAHRHEHAERQGRERYAERQRRPDTLIGASNAFATLKSAAEAQMAGGVKAVFVAGNVNGWLFWNTDATPGTAEQAVALTGLTSLNNFAVGDLAQDGVPPLSFRWPLA